ncbi:11740_t:CDS:2 [Entrophospora sp. SA101]|nr:11740_t:CDS:2 [Entrophospora sp. SA101]
MTITAAKPEILASYNRGILQDSQYDVNQVESIYLKELALVEASKNPIYVKLLGVGNEIA